MKTYRIKATFTTYVYADIQADSKHQAWDIGRDMDGEGFKECDLGNWEIYDVEEIEELENAL
jgi:hypothetical protein